MTKICLFSISRQLIRLICKFTRKILFLVYTDHRRNLSYRCAVFQFFLNLKESALAYKFGDHNNLCGIRSLAFFLYDDSSYDSDWDDDSWDSGWDSNDSWDSGYDDWGSDW